MTSTSQISWEEAVRQLKAQPENAKLVEACFFDDPLLSAAQRFHGGSEWAASRKLLGPTRGAALDVGAGRGIASYALGRDGWTVSALEPDASDLVGAGAIRSLAHEAGLSINVVQNWGEQLPFPDATFNLVYCRQVLHHARDLSQLCSEIARVLKPAGTLLAVREHVISQAADLQLFLDSHPLHRFYGGEHAYTVAQYQNAITSAGLTMTQVLNSYASDINLYPQTQADCKRQFLARLKLPAILAHGVPNAALAWAGKHARDPGRLYSFVAHKPSAERLR